MGLFEKIKKEKMTVKLVACGTVLKTDCKNLVEQHENSFGAYFAQACDECVGRKNDDHI